MEKAEIKVLDASELFKNKHFDYLLHVEKLEIEKRVDDSLSIIIGVFIDGENKYCAVIDFKKDALHLREVGGKFLKYGYPLDVFLTALAKYYNKQKITIFTSYRAVKNYISKIGFVENDYLFERKVA